MAWWIWLIIALAIGAIEVASTTFVLLWIAIAGLITTVLTTVIHGVWPQFACFAVISIVLYIVTRPLARKWRGNRTYPEPNAAIVGKTGIVITAEQPGGYATVRVDGQLWSAESMHKLSPDDRIRVVHATATVLTVVPVESPVAEEEEHA